jgi:predicted phage terminase large subunit-like protein
MPEFISRRNYTDTADEGSDYLCSIVYGETADHKAYVLDVLFTKAPMEETENAHAMQIVNNKVNRVRIESNNGGRGFSRNSNRRVKELGYRRAVYEPFHQSGNKNSRILSNAAWVETNIYFPESWALLWPEYYEAMTTYQKEGKNKHDDAPDATTGIAETIVNETAVEPVNVTETINVFKKLGL